jgi:hypothetical protein
MRVHPFTFAVAADKEREHAVRLEPCDISDISPGMWEQLAAALTLETALFPYPASLLAKRCEEGYGAIAIADGSIASYIALVPIIDHGPEVPNWAMLAGGLDLASQVWPATNVYLITTGWTAPAWRGLGINVSLRQRLVRQYLGPGNLALGGMVGLTSPMLFQLGWRIVGWDHLPYVSSLVAVPVQEFPGRAADVWHLPPGMSRYQGPHIELDATDHPWQEYLYFWVSDIALAKELDEQLQTLFCGDLHHWRSVILDVLCGDAGMCKVALLGR